MVTPRLKLRVLIVEDVQRRREQMLIALGDKVEPIEADSISVAKQLFYDYGGEFDAVIMDGWMKAEKTLTLGLVREIREAGYTGPIVTASNDIEYNERLMNAGCDHMSSKSQAAYVVLDVLGFAA